MNKKVELVQSVFGITLPASEMYVSGIKIEENQKEENGITYPSSWKHENGTLLPLEFEQYLPKESMSPEQAIQQLDVCSSLARGWKNDSYKLYKQEVMMRFHKIAITNCLYLASKNFASWLKKDKNEKDYLSKVASEMFVFHEAFSREGSSNLHEEEMSFLFLKLKLENDYSLKKGDVLDNGNIHSNDLFNNLFSIFFRRNGSGDDDIARSVSKMLQQKCYDVVEQLEKIK